MSPVWSRGGDETSSGSEKQTRASTYSSVLRKRERGTERRGLKTNPSAPGRLRSLGKRPPRSGYQGGRGMHSGRKAGGRVELAHTTSARTARDSNMHTVCRGSRAAVCGAGDIFVTSTVIIFCDNSSRTHGALTIRERRAAES